MGQTVEVPTEILNKFLRATRALDDFRDAMEDFFIANNPAMLRKLRKARREDQAGKARHFQEFVEALRRSRRHTTQLRFLLDLTPISWYTIS